MVAAADPSPSVARRMFKARLTNVLVGCATGLGFVIAFGSKEWLLPIALAVAVLISTFLVRVQTMWRQTPITAAVVIAAALVHGSASAGIGQGLHKVGEVLFGCIVGMVVSLGMSKLWLVQPPVPESVEG